MSDDINVFDEFNLALDRVMQYMNVHDLEYVQHQLNDTQKWQSFIDKTKRKLEITIFTKEFASDCSVLPSDKLQEIDSDDGRFNMIIKQELDERKRRQLAREDVEQYVYNHNIHGYHHLHGKDLVWMSYWNKISECISCHAPYESLDVRTRFKHEWCPWSAFSKSIGRYSDEERAQELRMLERVYIWGLETHYCTWLEAIFSNVTAKNLFAVMEHLVCEHCVHVINFMVHYNMKPLYDRVMQITHKAYVNHGQHSLEWELSEDLLTWINITRGMLNLGINVYNEFEIIVLAIPSRSINHNVYPAMMIKCLEHVTDIPELSQCIQKCVLYYIKNEPYHLKQNRQHIKIPLSHVTCPQLKAELMVY